MVKIKPHRQEGAHLMLPPIVSYQLNATVHRTRSIDHLPRSYHLNTGRNHQSRNLNNIATKEDGYLSMVLPPVLYERGAKDYKFCTMLVLLFHWIYE